MNSGKNVLIVGVGGQGVLLASEILSSVAVEAGYDAKKSEVHGMSQRGGVVSSHIRFGKKVYSPLINEGDADVILAFEEAEALRWIHFLKDDGVVIVNEYKLVPPIVVTEKLKYPDDPLKTISKSVSKLISIDAGSEAENLGNPRLVNTILLGILSTTLPVKEEIWIDVIRKRVPKGTEELNVKAFKKGREFK